MAQWEAWHQQVLLVLLAASVEAAHREEAVERQVPHQDREA